MYLVIARWGVVPALAAASLTCPALAQDPDQGDQVDQHIIAGVAAAYRPEFKGSNDYEVQPFPYLSVTYPISGTSLSLEGSTLKLDVLSSKQMSFGPLVSFQQGRDEDITNAVVRRLPSIDDAIEGGAYFGMEWPMGPGSLTTRVTALADLSGVHEGYSVTLDAGYRMPITSNLSFGVGADVKWADEKYLQTYYGVDLLGAAASGLSAYAPGGGLEKAGVSVNLTYRLTDRWGVALIGAYDRILDSAADSPIVTVEGSPDQYTGALALFYRF